LKDRFDDVYEFINYLEVTGDVRTAEITRRQYNLEEPEGPVEAADLEEQRQIEK
jgi:hypothetical protein